MDVLHIYGQPSWHQPAEISGDRAGLKQLKLAIEYALLNGTGIVDLFQNDGEGYKLTVNCLTDEDVNSLAHAYTDLPTGDPSE